MSIEEQRLVLLSQYALNFGILDIRENLLRYLVLWGLASGRGQTPLQASQISTRIAELLGLKVLHYPQDAITQQLLELEKDEKVTKVGNAFVATPTTVEALEQDASSARNVHRVVLEKMFLRLGANLSSADKSEVAGALYSFLGDVFSLDGERFAKIFIQAKIPDSPFETLDIKERLSRNARNKFLNETMRRQFVEATSKELKSPDRDWQEFLGTIAQCYRIMAILNLAPDINAIQFENVRQIFQGSRIYLDTNIVLSLLDPGCQFHKSNVQLIKECQGIGMQFLMTEMTKQETVAQLRREENLIRHAPPIPPSLAGKVVDLIEEPFVRAYYHALVKNPNTTWEYFFARLEEVDSLMRNLYAIEYDPATLENSMRNLDRFETVVLNVVDLFEKLRKRPKSLETAEHDAFHFMYVAELQKLSPNTVLFLTADRTLSELPKRIKEQKLNGFTVYFEQLLDLALPFLRPEIAQRTAAEVYSEYFSSAFMTAVGQTIPIAVLSRLVRPWMEHEGLTAKNVGHILQKTYVDKVLSEKQQVKSLESDKASVDAALIEQLRSEIEREKKAELDTLYAELLDAAQEKLDLRIEEVHSKYREASRIDTEIVRFLSERGVSTLADIAISTSLLPEEVCRGVSELSRYGLIQIFGTASTDVDTLTQYFLDSHLKVRLSRRGHLAAPAYIKKAGA